MDIIRKTLDRTSTRYLVAVSESFTFYILSVLGSVLNIFFNRAATHSSQSLNTREQVTRSIESLIQRLEDLGRELNPRGGFFPRGEDMAGFHQTEVGYSAAEQTCRAWFVSLCRTQAGVMVSEDVLVFCESINKSPLDVVFLYLAFKMGAKTSGMFKEREWVTGMSALNITSSEVLCSRWEELRAELAQPAVEREVYRFSYKYSRENDRDDNNIKADTACKLISLFLDGKWTYCKHFVKYIQSLKLRTLTQDQYVNVLDFSRSVKSLTCYDDTAPWPVLMDDFVSHYNCHPEEYKDEEVATGLSDRFGKITFSGEFEQDRNCKI